MSDILNDRLDLSTQDSAKKALTDIHTAVRDMQGDTIPKGTMDKLTTDVAAVSKAVAEMKNRADQPTVTSGPESELKRYLAGDRVRLTGENTEARGWSAGILDDAPVCEWQGDLQRAVEDFTLAKAMMSGSRRYPTKHASKVMDLVGRAPSSVARAFGDIAGAGAEFIPDVVLPQLERDLTANRRVAALFQTVPMTNKDLKLPFLSQGAKPYIKGAITGDTPGQLAATSISSAQRSFSAVALATRIVVDEDAAEDTIMDSMTILRDEIMRAIVDAEEDAIINGDTAGTHQDDLTNWNVRGRWEGTLGGASDHRKAWLGLRARAFDVSAATDQSAAATFAGFMTARANLDSPHGLEGDLVCIVSPEYYINNMMQFTEVLSMDKMGPQATVLSGQLASLAGVPIVVSELMSADLNGSGVYDNTTTNKTGFLMLNRTRFKLGQRRGARVRVQPEIDRGIFHLISDVREVFYTVDSATKKNVHFSYNL
jgi:HK97 family phage major capsid protein